jgi:hypothetical protein
MVFDVGVSVNVFVSVLVVKEVNNMVSNMNTYFFTITLKYFESQQI